MLEQLMSSTISQNALSGMDAANNPPAADPRDVARFNMSLHDKKVEKSELLNIAPKADDGFLQLKQPQQTSSIFKMDQEYKVLLDRLKEPPNFDKHWDVKKADEKPVFRSNTMAAEKPSLEKSLDSLLDDFKNSHKAYAGIMKDTRQWSLRTHIWSGNIHALTAIVGQVSSGFKSLFHSAG